MLILVLYVCCVYELTLVSDRFDDQLQFIKSVWDEVETSLVYCLELAQNSNTYIWSVVVISPSLYTFCTQLVLSLIMLCNMLQGTHCGKGKHKVYNPD